MYTEFYNLNARPFQLSPDPLFYFDTATHRKAMAYLGYGLAQGEGFLIVTGDVGVGKTTLVGHLMASIDRTRTIVGKIVTTHLDADNLLKMVASAFGVPVEGADKSTLLTRLEHYLVVHYREGRRALLIVDEAQNLPVAALEELRMLSNFQEGTRALLQTLLLGQPEFRDKLAMSPTLEQLRQRVIVTHHLDPMERDELPSYVRHRLTLCGWVNDPSFTPAAFDAIFDFSGGVPRKINSLCERIMLFGALEERHQIDEAAVLEVIEDLRGDTALSQASMPAGRRADMAIGIGAVPVEALTTNPGLQQRLVGLEEQMARQENVLLSILDLLEAWAPSATPEPADAGPETAEAGA